MTKEQVIEKVIEIIKDSADIDEEVTLDTRVIEDLGLSSMEAVLILGDLENEFGIDLPVSELHDVVTVSDFCRHVLNKLGG